MMKTKYIFYIICIFLAAILFFGCAGSANIKSNQALDSATVKNMIDSQSFVFIPQSVTPMGGRTRDLSAGFDIAISKDSVISYLPYFGRGYVAPLSPTDVDFDFTSTKFTYKLVAVSKGWSISIKPKDQRNLQELYFRIFDNASATLNVISLDRSFVSYKGYITKKRN